MARVLGKIAAFGGAIGLGALGMRTYQQGLNASDVSADGVATTSCAQRFNAFASHRDGKLRAMTFDDFIVSLCRGEAPESPEAAAVSANKSTTNELTRLFRFFDSNGDNLLSYEEFCVLYTIVSTSESAFETAFQMFDKEATGAVCAAQFVQMVTALSADPTAKLDFGPKSGLMAHFFGNDRQRVLKVGTFLKMTRELRRELLRTEFNMADAGGKGKMSVGALRRLVYHKADAEMTSKAVNAVAGTRAEASALDEDDSKGRRRAGDRKKHAVAVAKARRKEIVDGPIATQEDYLQLLDVLQAAPAWSRSLELYQSAHGDENASSVCDRKAFDRALRTAGLICSPRHVELFFRVFDVDDSGTLEHDELSDIADARRSFFAKYTPDFNAPKRNAVQEFVYCMQQKS
jgi:Ca2+-binding EF-hand superfamily protein